ncbi:sterol desaturase family protein [Halovulum sp. GXIMD14793]
MHDFFRYLIGAGGVHLVVNVWLARRLAGRKIRPETPGRAQIVREILISQRTALIFAAFGFLTMVAAVHGIIPVYQDVGRYGWGYLITATLLMILAQDAYFYWAPWLMHKTRLLRRIHLLHHKSHNPTAFTSYAFDWGEAMAHAVFFPAFLLLVPMHPLGLLAFAAHMMLRNALGHCGVEVYPATARHRPLLGWMTTVTHHDLHHAQAGYNFDLLWLPPGMQEVSD